MSIKVNALFLLVLFLMPFSSWGLSSDKNQAIHIEADQLEIRENDNVSFYQGNVRLQQGSLFIQADSLTLQLDQQKKLNTMQMQGNPASYRQKSDDGVLIKGSALEMDYAAANSIMLLLGQAKVISGSDVIESHRIQINTETNAMQAGDANGDSKNRVRMQIQPASASQEAQ